ncbi:unnamed protein product [Lampetra planeri]
MAMTSAAVRFGLALIVVKFAAMGPVKAEGNCAGRCGQVTLGDCSCTPSCQALDSCCPDFAHRCLEISPKSGCHVGGDDLKIINIRFNRTQGVICRFGEDKVDVVGHLDGDGHAHCVSPLVYETRRITFQLSVDGGFSFPHEGTWVAVHPGKVKGGAAAQMHNSTHWQYYGTPGVGGKLTLNWNASKLRSPAVNVEVWGYRETGEAYGAAWVAQWLYLYTLARDVDNSGSFTFLPKPALPEFSVYEFGMLRIASSNYSDGQPNVLAAWSDDHAMAWHLEEKFRADPAAWALQKCLAWNENETSILPPFLPEIADCPCTLAQARADTGRFQADYGCDIEKGSKCTYHPGAVHCVRAIQASPRYAAGQQCCYDARGVQLLTVDSVGGGTPDRGHDWGSPPYRRPPRVPAASHWLYDVVTFYYCCLWSDNCDYYLHHRPSSDCRAYVPPKIGSALGDPHFLTFGNLSITFNGRGEYTLLEAASHSLVVQIRTDVAHDPDGNAVNATVITSVAMRENGSDLVEVRVQRESVALQVLLNGGAVTFDEQDWMDLHGVFVNSVVMSNVTVTFPSGAAVEVRLMPGSLAVSLLLPRNFSGQTRGLLGVLDGGLSFPDGTTLPEDASPEQMYSFGASWAIDNSSTLFTYDSQDLLDRYYHQPRHDPAFRPEFRPVAGGGGGGPSPPIVAQLCGPDELCKFDAAATSSLSAANATLLAHRWHQGVVRDLTPVVSCGVLLAPKHGSKEGTMYLEGGRLTFACDSGYVLSGSSARECQPHGRWSGQDASCVTDNTLAIVLGCVFAVLVLAIAGFFIYKQLRVRHK